MTKPTDRLGQPLSLGDWVEIVEPAWPACGERFKVDEFLIADDGFWRAVDSSKHDGIKFLFRCECLQKINPKPETTTWDKCFFVPEGVTCK